MTEPLRPAHPSPCIGICRIDPSYGCCVGCYRTLDEICDWLTLDDKFRDEVLRRCQQRRSRLAPEPGRTD